MSITSIPVCDIEALRNGSGRQQARVVLDIGAAARTVGFFSVVNHGIPDFLTAQAFAAARRFFALPAQEKERVATDALAAYRGYSHTGLRSGAAGSPAEAEEAFTLGRDLAANDPDIAAGTPFAGFNRWPDLAGFREPATAYFKAVNAVATALQRAFALDLSMPPDFFTRYCDRPLTTLRLLRYPGDRASAAGARNDWGIFTLIAQDDGGGFDVQGRDGAWLAVDAVPGALLCTIGDCLMRWSNDRYMSRPHRVVNRAARASYALAFSADPNPDTLIACLPTCQDEDDPAKYAPISYAAYQQERFASGAGVATL